jgi:3-oxoadipate enol-lactonase
LNAAPRPGSYTYSLQVVNTIKIGPVAAIETGSQEVLDSIGKGATVLRQVGAITRHSTLRRLGRISCPTLIVTGTADRLVPPANSRVLQARIPGARLRFFEGGHLFMMQDPRAMPDILGFLAGGPAGEAS